MLATNLGTSEASAYPADFAITISDLTVRMIRGPETVPIVFTIQLQSVN